jgi:FMN phosphatase YigB (HAD superfamily)
MSVNEGIIMSDTKSLMKSEMLRRLALLKETTPDEWERSVFESLTGHKREDVDWDFEDNQAGYYAWIRSFDHLISELEEDGYVRVAEVDGNRKVLLVTESDPPDDYSQFVYPSRTKGNGSARGTRPGVRAARAGGGRKRKTA